MEQHERKPRQPIREYYQKELPENVGSGEARQVVLAELSRAEPRVLSALAEKCYRRLTVTVPNLNEASPGDWCEPLDELLWGHVRDAGKILPSYGFALYGNLVPLKDSILCWMKDGRRHRWNLCDNGGAPLEWIADEALQTLGFWRLKGRLPKRLSWLNCDLHGYWETPHVEKAQDLIVLEEQIDADSGITQVFPKGGSKYERLSDRDRRKAEKSYRLLANDMELDKLPSVSRRYFRWYALRTFLGWKLREIREIELQEYGPTGLGNPKDREDLSAISHGLEKVAALVGFTRMSAHEKFNKL
jgi:hypothetical protein